MNLICAQRTKYSTAAAGHTQTQTYVPVHHEAFLILSGPPSTCYEQC